MSGSPARRSSATGLRSVFMSRMAANRLRRRAAGNALIRRRSAAWRFRRRPRRRSGWPSWPAVHHGEERHDLHGTAASSPASSPRCSGCTCWSSAAAPLRRAVPRQPGPAGAAATIVVRGRAGGGLPGAVALLGRRPGRRCRRRAARGCHPPAGHRRVRLDEGDGSRRRAVCMLQRQAAHLFMNQLLKTFASASSRSAAAAADDLRVDPGAALDGPRPCTGPRWARRASRRSRTSPRLNSQVADEGWPGATGTARTPVPLPAARWTPRRRAARRRQSPGRRRDSLGERNAAERAATLKFSTYDRALHGLGEVTVEDQLQARLRRGLHQTLADPHHQRPRPSTRRRPTLRRLTTTW